MAVPAVPRTLTGKKMEVPVKRLLQGRPLAEVAAPGATADPHALDFFVELRGGRDVDTTHEGRTDGIPATVPRRDDVAVPDWADVFDAPTYKAFVDAVTKDLTRRGFKVHDRRRYAVVDHGTAEPYKFGLTNLVQLCAPDRATRLGRARSRSTSPAC